MKLIEYIEKELNPKYMNDTFTWKQIKDALEPASPLLLDRIPTDGIDKIKHLLHLHACEQEGLSSGQPTPQDWIKAVDEANEAIDRLGSASSGEETDVSKAIGLIHEWLRSDDCWIEDQDGNKIEGAIITGNGNSLYDYVSNGLGLPPNKEAKI